MLIKVEELNLVTDERVILQPFSFSIDRGEIVALRGKSGVGKTSIGLAILGLLPSGIHLKKGTITWFGHPEKEMICPRDSAIWSSLRPNQIGYIQQDVFGIFDPVLRIGRQMSLIIEETTGREPYDIKQELRLKMAEVGITDIDRVWRSFPHQLSGGQLQRCQICLSIIIRPLLLIADEPTSAIDKINQIELLDLFSHVRDKYQMAILCITHDEGVVKYIADRHIDLSGYAGDTDDIIRNRTESSEVEGIPVLETVSLGYTHRYGGLLDKKGAGIHNLNVTLNEGQCLGIIGESGSGKSTLAQVLVGLITSSEGKVKLRGREIDFTKKEDIRYLRSRIQLVMQDGRGSLHPNRTVRWLLQAVVDQRRKADKIFNMDLTRSMDQVGLDHEVLDRYEYSLSGGECLRISIARALLMQPDVLICDESTTSLDGPARDGIIELLLSLMRDQKLAVILISHDDTIIRWIADDLIVLAGGEVVEAGKTELVTANPTHPITKKIFAADATLSRKRNL